MDLFWYVFVYWVIYYKFEFLTQLQAISFLYFPLKSWGNKGVRWLLKKQFYIELVSKELNHFGVIADLFRQIGGHSSRFVLFCSFCRLFTTKMTKSVKVFPFSFWKIITFFFYFIKFKPRHKYAKWPPSDLTPCTLTLE